MVIFEHKNSKIQIQCNSLLYFLKTSLNLLEKRIIQEYVVKIHHSLYPIIENNELIVTFDEKGESRDLTIEQEQYLADRIEDFVFIDETPEPKKEVVPEPKPEEVKQPVKKRTTRKKADTTEE